MLIDSDDIDINEINRINIVMGGDHGQESMKIMYKMNNGKRCESIQPVGCILCKKNNSIILKNATIKDLGDSIHLINESMIFNNQHISPSIIYVTGYLTLLDILLGKEHSSPHWCIKCNPSSKKCKAFGHSMDNEWIIETLKLMSHPGRKGADF